MNTIEESELTCKFTAADIQNAIEKTNQEWIDRINEKITIFDKLNTSDAILIKFYLKSILPKNLEPINITPPLDFHYHTKIKYCSTCKYFKDNSPYVPCTVCYDHDRWTSIDIIIDNNPMSDIIY